MNIVKKIIRPAIAIAIIIGVTLSVGVAIKYMVKISDPNSDEFFKIKTIIPLEVNDTTIHLDVNNSEIWYDVVWLTIEEPTKIIVPPIEGYEIRIHEQKITSLGGTLEIPVLEMGKKIPIEIVLIDIVNKIEKKYYIRTQHSAIPDFTVLGEGSGKYYFTSNHFMYKMNEKGEIIYYRVTTDAFDFKKREIKGNVYYTYLELTGNEKNPKLDEVGVELAKAIIMDESYKIIDEVEFLIESTAVSLNYSLDNHDFIMLDVGHYIISGYVAKRINNIPENTEHSVYGTRVVAWIAQEIKNDQVLWQWDSTEHPELYELSVEGNDYFNETSYWADYMHFNSITIDPADGNYICSFRHLSAVLKIDSKNGDIIWILGGKGDQFGLEEIQLFSGQHHATVTSDGNILLFDNGNDFVGLERENYIPKSRVLEFGIDESNKKITSFKEIGIEKAYSPAMGSAQKLSKNTYLIGWGTRDTRNALFSEIDINNNKVLFEVLNPRSYFYSDSYRSYKFDE